MPKGVFIRTDEHKRKMREAFKKRFLKLGYINSPETRKKLSLANLGKKHTEESKKKMSLAKIGRKLSNEHKQKLKDTNVKFWLGKKRSEETIMKMKLNHKKGFFSEEIRKKIGQRSLGNKYNLGKKHSEETKRKMSIASKGKLKPWFKGKPLTVEHKENVRKSLLGIKRSESFKKEISERMKGEKNHAWKGGITPINEKIRASLEYKLWRESVFKRDNWKCQICGDNRGGNLQANHIKLFSTYPDLRFDIKNGITLCKICHSKIRKNEYKFEYFFSMIVLKNSNI